MEHRSFDWWWTVDVFALSGFAVAQPLYDLLARHPGFLIAHDVGRSRILFLVLLLSLCVPAVLLVATGLVVRFLPRSQGFVRGLTVAILAMATFLPPLGRLEIVPGPWVLIAASFVGITIGWHYVQGRALRLFCHCLAPSIVVFPVVFLLHGTAAKLLSGQLQPTRQLPEVDARDPVVMVVLDELPTVSLLDEDLQIDRVRFPNFAAFADEATWYRNASGVHQSTDYALPAIVSGCRPEMSRVPYAADYPLGVFTLLGSSHRLHVSEAYTELCPSWLNDSTSSQRGQGLNSAKQLLADLAIVYANLLLPDDARPDLPRITQTWRDFGARPALSASATAAGNYGQRMRQFREFIDSIDVTDRPGFYFLHVLLPHVPWSYAATGQLYLPENMMYVPGLAYQTEIWQSDPWLVRQALERHTMQLQLVDRLLGKLFERLRSLDLYDHALIVVTADHGMGFEPGESRRDPAAAQHPEDIFSVPLLIKVPGQQEPEVSDENVETIDILPTVASLLGSQVSWEIDGRSLVDREASGPTTKRMMNQSGQVVAIPGKEADRLAASWRRLDALRKVSAATTAEAGIDSRFLARIVGLPVSDVALGSPLDWEVRLLPELSEWQRLYGNAFLPLLITGNVQGEFDDSRRKRIVAVAVNGTIRRLAPLYKSGTDTMSLSVLLPETAFEDGDNALAIFLLDGDDAQPVLRPMTVVPGRLRVKLDQR